MAKVLDAEIDFGRDGRPTGTATVLFGSLAEAKAALAKNKENMGSRWATVPVPKASFLPLLPVSVFVSGVDPNPVGSEIICRIRIRQAPLFRD